MTNTPKKNLNNNNNNYIYINLHFDHSDVRDGIYHFFFSFFLTFVTFFVCLFICLLCYLLEFSSMLRIKLIVFWLRDFVIIIIIIFHRRSFNSLFILKFIHFLSFFYLYHSHGKSFLLIRFVDFFCRTLLFTPQKKLYFFSYSSRFYYIFVFFISFVLYAGRAI